MRRVMMGAVGTMALGFALALPGGAAIAGGTGERSPLLDPLTELPGLRVGDKAPEATFTLPDGSEVSLRSILDKGPVVLTFYRGGWCPFCQRALAAWQPRMEEVAALGATFVAVSPEAPDKAEATGTTFAPSAMVVSDLSGDAARDFRVAFEMAGDLQETYKGYGVDLSKHNASGAWELPAPALYVLDTDGVVRWVFAEWDYKKRADPDEVMTALRAVAGRR